MKYIIKKIRGFSLIEFVIVITIMGFVAVISSALIFHTFRTYYAITVMSDLDSQARVVFNRMTKDFREIQTNQSGFSFVQDSEATDQITFNDADANSITYAISGGNLVRNSQILATNVSDLKFTFYDQAGGTTTTPLLVRYIKFMFTISKSQSTQSGEPSEARSITITSAVFPRNFE